MRIRRRRAAIFAVTAIGALAAASAAFAITNNTSTATLTVHWSQAAAAPPELFEPASFPASSPVPYASPGAPAAKATP